MDSSPLTVDIGKLMLRSRLLRSESGVASYSDGPTALCGNVSGKQLVPHGQTKLFPNCVCFICCSPTVSASSAVPQLRPIQLLLPDCVPFSCCSPIVFACHYARAVQSIIRTKVMRHQCSPAPRTPNFHNARKHTCTHTTKILT